MDLKSVIRSIPDHPKPGILFYDVTTLIGDAAGFAAAVDALVAACAGKRIDKVAGIEARGFIFGGVLAKALGVGFVPVRKKGKLPFKTLSESYELEYGTDSIEIHIDAVAPGEQVLLIDDLIATGGTAVAAIRILERAGAEVVGCQFVIDLPFLGGSDKIRALGKDVLTLVTYDSE